MVRAVRGLIHRFGTSVRRESMFPFIDRPHEVTRLVDRLGYPHVWQVRAHPRMPLERLAEVQHYGEHIVCSLLAELTKVLVGIA